MDLIFSILSILIIAGILWGAYIGVRKFKSHNIPPKYQKGLQILGFGMTSCLYGVLMSCLGWWGIFAVGIGIWIAIPQFIYFKKIVDSKIWTLVYVVFYVCSFLWVIDLSGWSDSSGPKTGTGFIFFVIASLIILIIAKVYKKYPFSPVLAILMMAICILGTMHEPILASKLLCSANKPILEGSSCYACDEPKTLWTFESRCALCGDMREFNDDNKCELKKNK